MMVPEHGPELSNEPRSSAQLRQAAAATYMLEGGEDACKTLWFNDSGVWEGARVGHSDASCKATCSEDVDDVVAQGLRVANLAPPPLHIGL
jgi:hypothetical protein